MTAVWAERLIERTNVSRKASLLTTVTMLSNVGIPSSVWNAPMTTTAVGTSRNSVT